MYDILQLGRPLNSQDEVSEPYALVEVSFARSDDDARLQCAQLVERSIPAQVESPAGLPPECGVAVLIPPDRLVEAAEYLSVHAEDEQMDDDPFASDEDEDFIEDDDLPEDTVEDEVEVEVEDEDEDKEAEEEEPDFEPDFEPYFDVFESGDSNQPI